MAAGLLADVRLGNGAHLNGGLYPNLNVTLLEAVGHSQCVNGGGQHPHMVSPDTLHPIAAVLHAAPKISAAHNDGDLNALFHTLLYHIAYFSDDVKIQTTPGISGQCFAADLEQHTFILRFAHIHSPLCFCGRNAPVDPISAPYSTLISVRMKEEICKFTLSEEKNRAS